MSETFSMGEENCWEARLKKKVYDPDLTSVFTVSRSFMIALRASSAVLLPFHADTAYQSISLCYENDN